jgi:hypothetical protein
MFKNPRRDLKLVGLKSGEKLTFTKTMVTEQAAIETIVRLFWLNSKRRFQTAIRGRRGRPAALSQVQFPKLLSKRVPYFLKTKQRKDYIMPLIHVVLVLIVVGVLLWLVNSYIPMAGSIKAILNAVVVIAVVLWLLSVFGLMGEISKIRVGK